MSSYIDQAKDLIGALVDGVLPSNSVLIKHTKSLARRNLSVWKSNLAINGLIVNPDGVDMFDLGTIVNGVYVPDATQLNPMLAFNIRERVRSYLVGEILSDRQATDVAVVGDAGQTPKEIEAASRVAALAETLSELGDPNNDPES